MRNVSLITFWLKDRKVLGIQSKDDIKYKRKPHHRINETKQIKFII